MNGSIQIQMRLAALLEEKQVTAEELSLASGLPLERIQEYCEGEMDVVSLNELSSILSALGCGQVSDILEETFIGVGADDLEAMAPLSEGEWYTPCPASPDGRHRWYKDLKASDTVYQEFCCQACSKRLSVIL